MSRRTTISVHEDTRDAIYYEKEPTESYDDFLSRVFDVDVDATDGE